MRNFYFVLFIITCSISNIYSQVLKENTPVWVETIGYSEIEINNEDVNDGAFILLYDNQIHAAKQVAYTRFAMKITDNVGVQNASTVNVSYDPTYQNLKFHSINIIRDGVTINKLDVANFQVMRRELNAEIYLYDGSLSAVMNISDVRTGDIIDYSYSIYGFNPLSKKFSASFYLNDIEPVGKINVSILSENKLRHKTFNTNLKPKLSTVNNLYKYQWLTTNPEKLDYEDNTPTWKIIYATLFVSEYKSWAEVVDWGLNLYTVDKQIDKELRIKINEINTTYKTEGEKIKATLDFVQNDIRYLGLEFGIGGYKPFAPNTVFERRFGDCKDKSLLMVTMLNAMEIKAYPVLVNTNLKQTIWDILPSPRFFDHCVVNVVDRQNNKWWYDPTIANQGGDYKTTHFPNYEHGLIIKKENEDIDQIFTKSKNIVETNETYTLNEIGKGAILEVTTKYYENEADNMRNYFKNNSTNTIQKQFEEFYSDYYFNITSTAPPMYTDSIKKNVFIIKESYKIDSLWEPMQERKNHISATFIPSSLVNVLYIPNKEERKTDLALNYPSTKVHKIKINLPTEWEINNEDINITSPWLYYDWKVKYNRKNKVIDIYHLLKIQKNNITKHEYKGYIKDFNKLDTSVGYYLYCPENYTGSNFAISDSITDSIFNLFKAGIFIGLIVITILFGFWYYNKKKSKPQI